MSDQAKSYLRQAATLIELASGLEDHGLRCELVDTALLYERLADFATEQEGKEEDTDASVDHRRP